MAYHTLAMKHWVHGLQYGCTDGGEMVELPAVVTVAPGGRAHNQYSYVSLSPQIRYWRQNFEGSRTTRRIPLFEHDISQQEHHRHEQRRG